MIDRYACRQLQVYDVYVVYKSRFYILCMYVWHIGHHTYMYACTTYMHTHPTLIHVFSSIRVTHHCMFQHTCMGTCTVITYKLLLLFVCCCAAHIHSTLWQRGGGDCDMKPTHAQAEACASMGHDIYIDMARAAPCLANNMLSKLILVVSYILRNFH
jgi:hypothetical protein